MTEDEFAEFWDHLQTAMPSAGKWIAGLDQPEETAGFWADKLADIDLDTAKRALDDTITSDPPKYDRDIEKLWVRVRRGAYKYSRSGDDQPRIVARNADGTVEFAFRCARCEDEGFLTCYHPKTTVAVARGVDFDARNDQGWYRETVYTQVLACPCEAGQRRNRPTFDALQHCQKTPGIGRTAQLDEIRGWLVDRVAPVEGWEHLPT